VSSSSIWIVSCGAARRRLVRSALVACTTAAALMAVVMMALACPPPQFTRVIQRRVLRADSVDAADVAGDVAAAWSQVAGAVVEGAPLRPRALPSRIRMETDVRAPAATCQRTSWSGDGGPVNASLAELAFPSWFSRVPSFVRLGHVLWWRDYEVTALRMACPGTEMTYVERTAYGDVVRVTVTRGAPVTTLLARAGSAEANASAAAFHADPAFPLMPNYEGWLHWCEGAYRHGDVIVASNATVSGAGPLGHTCDSEGDWTALLVNGASSSAIAASPAPHQHAKRVFWGDIPAVWTYQVSWPRDIRPPRRRVTLGSCDVAAVAAS